MDKGFPKIEFSKTSEIPAALGCLEADDLTKVVEARLQGERAGLPAPQRDEEPDDIILYAFRAGSEALRQRLREAISVLLMKHLTRAVAASKSQGSEPEPDGVLRRLFWLSGLTASREALPAIVGFWRVPEKKFLSPALQLDILKCLGSLANESDARLIPWLQEELVNPRNCRVALQALFKIDQNEAAKALPRAAETVLAGTEVSQAAGLLSQTLTLIVPSLSKEEQLQFLRLAGAALERGASPKALRAVTEAFELTPGLASEAQALLLNLKVKSLFEGMYPSCPGRAFSSSLDYIRQAATSLSYRTGNAFAYEFATRGTRLKTLTQAFWQRADVDALSKGRGAGYLGVRAIDNLALVKKEKGHRISQGIFPREARKRYCATEPYRRVYGRHGVGLSRGTFVEKHGQATPDLTDSGERQLTAQAAV